jgi:hypothetical protein
LVGPPSGTPTRRETGYWPALPFRRGAIPAAFPAPLYRPWRETGQLARESIGMGKTSMRFLGTPRAATERSV